MVHVALTVRDWAKVRSVAVPLIESVKSVWILVYLGSLRFPPVLLPQCVSARLAASVLITFISLRVAISLTTPIVEPANVDLGLGSVPFVINLRVSAHARKDTQTKRVKIVTTDITWMAKRRADHSPVISAVESLTVAVSVYRHAELPMINVPPAILGRPGIKKVLPVSTVHWTNQQKSCNLLVGRFSGQIHTYRVKSCYVLKLIL